jgi:hypothetical protein
LAFINRDRAVILSIKEAKDKIVEIAEEEWESSGIKGYKIATRGGTVEVRGRGTMLAYWLVGRRSL